MGGDLVEAAQIAVLGQQAHLEQQRLPPALVVGLDAQPVEGGLQLTQRGPGPAELAGAHQLPGAREQRPQRLLRPPRREQVARHALGASGPALEAQEARAGQVVRLEAVAVLRLLQQDVAQHRVREVERVGAALPLPAGEAVVEQIVEQLQLRRQAGHVADAPELQVPQPRPERGCELERGRVVHRAVGAGEERADAVGPHRHQVLGQGRVLRLPQPEPALARLQAPLVDPAAHQLHREQGVAGGALLDLRREVVVQREQLPDEEVVLRRRERSERELLDPGGAASLPELLGHRGAGGVGVHGGHDEDRRGLRRLVLGEEAREEQRLQAVVGIVQPHHERPTAGQPDQGAAEQHEHLALAL